MKKAGKSAKIKSNSTPQKCHKGNKNTKSKLEVYKHCLKKLKLKNDECIAIEDTEISLKSAVKAKIKCIAFPGDFHTDSKFKNSLIRVRKLKTDLIFN